MAAGIARCGDRVIALNETMRPAKADVAVMYGWGKRSIYQQYPNYVYGDLAYWGRDRDYYRLGVNGWSPERYVSAGLPNTRLQALGLQVKPWNDSGTQIIVAGSTAKACRDHGMGYMDWETRVCRELQARGLQVVYRPKPNDKMAKPISGIPYDTRPISEALRDAKAWVTHHSNSAIDALLAGVPVHCETGAAAAFSVPLDQIVEPPRMDGREQFLADVAWLQWSLDEMRSGACWAHLKERGLLC